MNEGVVYMCVCVLSHVWLFATPWTVANQARLSMRFSRQEYWSGFPLSSPGDLPDSGIEPMTLGSPALQAGSLSLCHLGSLLQGIFPTQGSSPGLLHCRQNLYQLSHQGRPRILEWVGYPFSSRSSWPRNQTRISCIAGGFFTNWAIRKVLLGGKWGEILDSSSLTPYTWFSLCSGNYMFKICVYFIFSLHLHC